MQNGVFMYMYKFDVALHKSYHHTNKRMPQIINSRGDFLGKGTYCQTPK